MAITNHERVGKAMELLKEGLRPFVEREFEAHYGETWRAQAAEALRQDRDWNDTGRRSAPGCHALLKLDVGPSGTRSSARRSATPSAAWSASCASVRNSWAHQEAFSSDDAYRALDTSARLLTAVSAPQADEVER